MARLSWTDQAIADLNNIAEFIAKDSVKYAKITISKIQISARTLRKFPYSGRKVPETDIENIRELIFGNYRIIYLVYGHENIYILTVHHSARRLNVTALKSRSGS